MKIDYDKEADALYIQLLNEVVYETEEIDAGVIVDYSKDNRVIGIEVLNVSKRAEILNSVRDLLNSNKRVSVAGTTPGCV